jgi:hypothetical protein
MRYLYYCYSRNAQIKQIVNSPGYKTAITKAADAARDNTIPTDGASLVFIPFNRLATLLMGMAMEMNYEEETVQDTAESVEEAG